MPNNTASDLSQSPGPERSGDGELRLLAAFAGRVQHFACWFHDRLDRNSYLFWAPFSLVFLLQAYLICQTKPLWYDELLSLHGSLLPDIGSIWEVTRSGALAEPPLFTIAGHLAVKVVPDPHFGLRLPAVLGIWVLCLCVFRFTRRIAGALCASVAVMTVLSTKVAIYIYEARPYGLLMGWVGLGLVSWQEAVRGQHRRLGLLGLAVSLFCAIQTHYYGVLLLFPLALGELIRTVSRKRMDAAVWGALAAGSSSVFILLPLIGAASDYTRHPWNPVSLEGLLRFHTELFAQLVPPVLLILGLLAVLRLGRNRLHEDEGPGPRVSEHELGVIVGLCAFPLVVFATSLLVTDSLSARYLLPTVVGYSILAAVFVLAAGGRRSLVGTVALASLSLWFCFNIWQTSNIVSHQRDKVPRPGALCPYDSKDQVPIVITNNHRFFQLSYYWLHDLGSRIYYLSNREAELRFTGTDSGELAVSRFAPWAPLKIRPYDTFLSRHREFLFLQKGGWQKDQLLADGAQLDLQGAIKDYSVYRVRLADWEGADSLEADPPKTQDGGYPSP